MYFLEYKNPTLVAERWDTNLYTCQQQVIRKETVTSIYCNKKKEDIATMPPKRDNKAAEKEEEEINVEMAEMERALAAQAEELHVKTRRLQEAEERIRRQQADLEAAAENRRRLQAAEDRIRGQQAELEETAEYRRRLQAAETELEEMAAAIPMRGMQGMGRQRQDVHVPLPRQMVFDGSDSWESFYQSFLSMSTTCAWRGAEALFRLKASLRGEAAEYVFTQLPPGVANTYADLIIALENRFKERRTIASYLAELEGRKLQQKEKITEYVSDIKRLIIKGFPTADNATRETIGLRYFLKGLPDQQMAVAVGMQDPTTLEMARAAVENYTSLKEEVSRPPRPRVNAVLAEATEGAQPETSRRIEQLETKIEQLMSLIKDNKDRRPRKKLSEIECYECRNKGHYARNCPNKDNSSSTQEQESSTPQGNA